MAREAIFIGYRRDDTADVAGRIYDALAGRFGRDRIFKDVDNLRPGADFGEYIETILPRCRVVLILIGPNWIDAKDESGHRRLDDPHDWVRIEIEMALNAGDLDVVPVLVNGARMPRPDELPSSLHPLLRRHAAIIRRDPDFHDDVARLSTALRSSINTGILDLSNIGGNARASVKQPRRRGQGLPLIIGAVAVTLLALGFAVPRWLRPQQTQLAEHQTRAPLPSVQAFRDCANDCPEMVRIPGQSFAAGQYEVTFAQWDACVAASGCGSYAPSDQGWGRGNRPVINVSWNDVQAYVQWLSQQTGQRYRLLTSAEWELAARAGTTTTYSWGDQEPKCDQGVNDGANFDSCNYGTLPVGSFQPNAFGLFDVHGNVWEWVEDCFDASCSYRVLRGGSWHNAFPDIGSSSRYFYHPADTHNIVGFRVARTL